MIRERLEEKTFVLAVKPLNKFVQHTTDDFVQWMKDVLDTNTDH